MTMWVVDCGPLGQVAAVADASWAWPAATLHVVREVEQEALQSGSQPNKRLFDCRTDGMPWVDVHDISIDSPAAVMLAEHLRPSGASASKNLGEDVSIAFCVAVATDAVLVTADKTAAFVALAELGRGRVASPFDLWEALHAEGRVSREAFDALCSRTARQLGAGLPGVPWRIQHRR